MKRHRGIVALVFCIAAVILYIAIPRPLLLDGLSFSKAVYDRDGALLRLTLSEDDKYRLRTPLSKVSPLLIETTLLHEDRYFRAHPGVNPIALLRAIWQTYVVGERRIGASTITMQLARMRYGINSRSVAGKLRQILRALQLERHYSKDEILEAYLNLAPYGRNIEGAGAASLIYFKKQAKKLTIHESLTLAIIPQSPALRTPLKSTDLGNAELTNARSMLAKRWVKTHSEDADKLSFLSLPMLTSPPSELPFLAPHFVNAVLSNDNANITTTLELGLQELLERRVKAYVERKRDRGISNAVAMVVDYRTMEVRAFVGSADFFNEEIEGQVNGARGKRSPGSTLKPFIYALAMDQGLIHPLTMLKDAPASYGAFNPENFDYEFAGPIKARDALIRSRNLPAIELSNKLSEPTLYDFLKAAGVKKLRDEEFYGLALTLGGAEMTMEELLELYAMLANKGVLRRLRMHKHGEDTMSLRLLSEESAFLVLDILKDNPRPGDAFRKAWTSDNTPVHWKTGTSYGFRDAWSIAVFGPYVLAVWVGNFNGEGSPAFVGRSAAAPLLFEIIDAMKSREADMPPPYKDGIRNLKKVEVCAVSGGLPSVECPHTVTTWFIPGRSPIKGCEIHREVVLDADTGLRACGSRTKKIKREVYEFWPSDLDKIFKQAGIPRRTPPPYSPECRLVGMAEKGIAPVITSPRRGIVYNIRAALEKKPDNNEKIALMAVTDADTVEVYWFIDERYLGKVQRNEPFFWQPEPGSFIVRVVDDHGRSNARNVEVVIVE
jgi:penicillin-binding protein 1C